MKTNLLLSIVLLTASMVNTACHKENSCENCRVNLPPIANAGPDQKIILPTDSTLLDGSKSSDPDGTIVSYKWAKISGPAFFNIVRPYSSKTPISKLLMGVYQFELTVTDTGGLSAKDTVQVIVNDPAVNQSPNADAGTDQTITLPMDSAYLDGTNSKDPDGTIVSYKWTKISGPFSSNIIAPDSSKTLAKVLVAGVYQFQLMVTDNKGLSAKDTVQVIVDDVSNARLPIADAGPDQTITLPLDSTYLDGSNSSPNGWSTATATYVWTKISGPSKYSLVPFTSLFTGYIPTTAVAESLVPGTYLFRLVVTDAAGASSSDTMKVTVVDDPLDKNTVTYNNLTWQAGDVYGLGLTDVFLTTSIRPDIFYGYSGYMPVQVYLSTDFSLTWTLVLKGGTDAFTYDEFPLTLWIIRYPNDLSLVGKKSSIKIKLL